MGESLLHEHRRSPAAHLTERMRRATVTGERTLGLKEMPFIEMVALRVAVDTDAAAGVEAVLGAALPRVCGDVTSLPAGSILWLSPDEFLVVGDRAPALVDTIAAQLGSQPGSVMDVSASRTALELTGNCARSLLEKGCALDLHPRALRPNTALVTTLAQVRVIVFKLDDERFLLLVPASFTDYLVTWIIDAAVEFAGEEIP